MTLRRDQERLAHLAMNRFGLGAKPGGIARIRDNPKAALKRELEKTGIADITNSTLPSYVQACQVVHTDFNAEHKLKEKELTARFNQHLKPEIGFVERLVLFFSNHFSMSILKDGAIRATIGQLERDVIRKNVLGSFNRMLLGVMKHPAMIRYLDNEDSIGPNSTSGINWGVGLNHNLAREILELHTLGVGGGYTEDDIDGLAKIITGWSFVRGWEAAGKYNGGNERNRGQFIYRKDWHEPGAQRVLGKLYGGSGVAQGESVLSDLARHPSTAQFIAFKLVHHFITDDPTPAMVEPLADAFKSSHGDLKAVAEALIDLPEAWTLPMTKIRTPYELQIAQFRALGRIYEADERWPFYSSLNTLRNIPWERVTPDGYPDETQYWEGPDAMRIRMETAPINSYSLLFKGPFKTAPAVLANQLFASAISKASLQAIANATEQYVGIATLFMIPEFQRR